MNWLQVTVTFFKKACGKPRWSQIMSVVDNLIRIIAQGKSAGLDTSELERGLKEHLLKAQKAQTKLEEVQRDQRNPR